jgi:transcriptional regulator with GAF, ATPase, and Fis domain
VPTLIALFGPKRGVRLDLAGSMVVGRASAADLQLVDGKVSREHCRFTVEGEKVFIEDLGSHNGTFVNGEAVTARRAVGRNDEIAVGDSLFVVDPDLTVASARFGEATLVVAPGVRPPVEEGESGERGGAIAAVRNLAASLVGVSTAEAASAAVLAAVEAALAPDRTFLLLGDGGARGLRALEGRQRGRPDPHLPAATVLARETLARAARRRRAVTALEEGEVRAFAEGRSVATRHPRAVVVAPLCMGEEVRGFLYAESRDGFRLDAPETLEGLAAVCVLHGLGGALGARADTAPAPLGTSPAFAKALKRAEVAAAVPSTVLITGETGTGKEEVARFIHRTGVRGGAPFVAVNCGAIPEALAESELFGHEKGAFTGAVAAQEGRLEAADGGTLFLDEVGELSAALQVKLLRVLQERIFFRVGSSTPRSLDIRIIAATHRDLEADVSSGRFREDLFYRLNVLRLHLPPLRERTEDIGPLADALSARLAQALGRPDPGLDEGARALLRQARWPGNVRELANVLERALVLREPGRRDRLGGDEIAEAMGAPGMRETTAPAVGTLPEKIAALERTEIGAALRAAQGVKSRAARLLGISRPTLDKKMADLDIETTSERPEGGA